MAYTLHNATIASTYDRLFTRNSTVPSTGTTTTGIVAMNDSGVDIVLPLYISTERVGIGTAVPMNLLQLSHSASDGDNGLLIVNEATSGIVGGNLLGAIGFDSADGNVPISCLHASAFIAAYAVEDHSTLDKGGALAFGTSLVDENDDTLSTEHIRIVSGGNVGIGTTAPTASLHILKSDSTTNAVQKGLIIQHATDGTAANGTGIGIELIGERANGGVVNLANIKAVLTDATNVDSALTFETRTAAAGSSFALKEQMRITDTGNVGIGATAPICPLNIGTDAPTLSFTSAGWRLNTLLNGHASANALGIVGSASDMYFLGATSTAFFIGYKADDDFASWGVGDSPNYLMSILQEGNVGIGTSAFSSGVRCLGLLNGTDPGTATTNTATFFAASGEMNYTDAAGAAATLDSLASDERMKDNITVIPDALSRLANLKGITFNYVSYKDSSLPFKDDIADDVKFNSHNLHGDNTRVGVIAQDVEKAYDGLNITNAVHHIPIESMVQGDMEDHVPEIYGDVKKLRVNTLIPLLIEAVKELSAKVTALENA